MHNIASSDHRVIYLDFNLIAYLIETDQRSSITTRLLSTKAPDSTRMYKRYLENYLEKTILKLNQSRIRLRTQQSPSRIFILSMYS